MANAWIWQIFQAVYITRNNKSQRNDSCWDFSHLGFGGGRKLSFPWLRESWKQLVASYHVEHLHCEKKVRLLSRTSLCIIGSSFIHLIRTDSNVFFLMAEGRKEGSGWGTRVYLWRIHVDIRQNQYKIVKLKNKIILKNKRLPSHLPAHWGVFSFPGPL